MSDIVTNTIQPAQQLDNAIATTAVDTGVHPIVQSVVQGVYNDPNIAPHNAAYVAASILNGVAQYAPAILQVTRASPVSATWAGIGIGVLSSIIEAFFPHPRLTTGQ